MNCAKWIWPNILLIGVVIAMDLMSLRTKKLDDTLSLLNDYEVTFPILVDNRGEFISYDVTHQGLLLNLPTRERRGVTSSRSLPIFYRVKTEDKAYVLNLTENKHITTRDSVVEVWKTDNVTEKRKSIANSCHFNGHIVGKRRSSVVISNCLGLHGIFSVSGQEYVIEPYWNHTNDVYTQGHPHIIYKRSSFKLNMNIREFQISTRSNTDRKRKKLHRRRRSVSTERYVETLVVADKKTVFYHGEEEIETYILTIMNIVAKLFRDASLGNAVNIVVSRIILLTEKQPGLEISFHAAQTLNSFCKWQETIKSPDNTVLYSRHDNAVLITRYDICFDKDEPCDTLGLAQVSGMCEKERSCSINQDIGLTSGFTIAHELGHNFGMQHDGSGNDCQVKLNAPGYIMSTQLSRLIHPVRWSRCSRQYITDFFDSDLGDCLRNVPMMNDYGFSDLLPGQRYDADKQCRSQFGPHSTECKDFHGKICGALWCSKQSGHCVSNNIPVLDGTACNTSTISNGWCYGGECAVYGTTPSSVNGNWGQWTEWGDCSRTCEGGVEASERHCDKPKPSHGGKFCVGKRKRYRSCNIQHCPKNSEDFRAVQCRKFNSVEFREKFYQWMPFITDQIKPCSLYCQAMGYNFYVEQAVKVIDGTRCYEDTLDVCVNGKCMHVGCDHILGSKVTEDRCGKCGGDGSTCRNRKGLLENKLENKINTYVEVVRIPKGATHILVSEKRKSSNYLAVMTIDGTISINGKWTISWPSTYYVAGTKFHYQRIEKQPESLRAIGPTTQELIVMILLQEPNKGIRYEFNEPVDFPIAIPDYIFKWSYSSWSNCSKSCGKGITRSEVFCVRKDDQSKVSDVYCARSRKPALKTRVCNPKPCPPKWSVGNWGKCSRSCGGGYKSRSVICIQKINHIEEKSVDEMMCETRRPVDKIKCNEKQCPTQWHIGKWSKCVGKCGSGHRNRTVICITRDRKRKLPDTSCSSKPKPPEMETCSNSVCPTSHWVTGRWLECESKCGKGQQRRQVQCKTWKGENDYSCTIESKPISIRECNGPCIENSDVCTDVNKAGYCNLVLKFKFCKRPYFSKMCCKTCNK